MEVNSIYLDEFHMDVFNTNTTTVVFQFVHKPSVWRGIRINFWISARQDIILGTFSKSNFVIIQTSIISKMVKATS